MADTKLSALTAATTLDTSDEFYVNDSGTSKRITKGNLQTGSDAKLVSGTAGTSGNLVSWDANGDAVDSGLAPSGSDASAITGTAGTSGDLAQWNADGDLVDGPTPPSGTIVGTTDTQTLTNKTLDNGSNTLQVNTATYSTDQTLTAAQCYGSVIYVTGAATITLPAVADGMSVTIVTVGAVAVSVDPNASDLIRLDGTALDDGDKITNTSTSGDIAVLTYYSADGWYAATNSWTDGGA